MDKPVDSGVTITRIIVKRIDKTLEDIAFLRIVKRIGIIRAPIIVFFNILDILGNPPMQQIGGCRSPAHHTIGDTVVIRRRIQLVAVIPSAAGCQKR